MSGKIPSRVRITKTQSNTPKFAGKAVPKGALINCGFGRNRVICQYIKSRAEPLPPPPTPPAGPPMITDANFFDVVDDWLAGGATRAAVIATYGEIGDWNVSQVTNMDRTFSAFRNPGLIATFNEDISNWNTGNVINMQSMFVHAANFAQNLENWNTSKVTTMKLMFSQATNFDGAIGNWDVSSVTNMSNMFLNAQAFNQNLEKWDINKITDPANLAGIFESATALIKIFSDAAGAPNGNWFATAEGLAPITNFYTDGTNYIAGGVAGKQPELTHGLITDTNFLDVVDDWLAGGATRAAVEATYGLIGAWDVGLVTNMQETFSIFRTLGAGESFNEDINNWNTGNVTKMKSMFLQAKSFDQDLQNWNTSKVTTMAQMFQGAEIFNGEISSWDTSSVSTMEKMFSAADAFNENIGAWNTGNVENMKSMFNGADNFNKDLVWNTSKVTDMTSMFSFATDFDGDISSWDTSKVTTMESMFNDATVFNGDISNWNTEKVTTMKSMFSQATVFNGDIFNWNTEKVTTMESMFNDATVFNRNITSWNVILVTNMKHMFDGASSFNNGGAAGTSMIPLTWGAKTQNVENMQFMFRLANLFNQSIGDWDVSSVQTFEGTFKNAQDFNQDLSAWDLSGLIGLAGELDNCFEDSGLAGQIWDATSSAGGIANSWHTKAFDNDPSAFYTDGASGANPTGLSQPFLEPPVAWAWTPRNFSSATWTDITSDISGEKLAAVDDANVQYSIDEGASWTTDALPGYCITSATDGALYKLVVGAGPAGPAAPADGIYFSNNYPTAGFVQAGSVSGPAPEGHWTDVTLSADGQTGAICSIPSTGLTGTIWTSFNNSMSWTDIGPTQTLNFKQNLNWSGITSSNDGIKLAATVDGSPSGNIWTSLDSGANWTERTIGPLAFRGITSSADGAKLAAVVYGGNIWLSTTSGTVWVEDGTIGSTKNWKSITSSDNGVELAAVVEDGSIWTSKDSGASWTQNTPPPGLTGLHWKSIASSAVGTKLAVVHASGATGAIWTGFYS